jgi:hypothetical protein|tara:strand:+ start:1328 stop:1501 length:174 start_codon:yes stop_codon:yes gene_type:complete
LYKGKVHWKRKKGCQTLKKETLMATKVAEMTLQWFFSKMLPIQWAMFSTPRDAPKLA